MKKTHFAGMMKIAEEVFELEPGIILTKNRKEPLISIRSVLISIAHFVYQANFVDIGEDFHRCTENVRHHIGNHEGRMEFFC